MNSTLRCSHCKQHIHNHAATCPRRVGPLAAYFIHRMDCACAAPHTHGNCCRKHKHEIWKSGVR